MHGVFEDVAAQPMKSVFLECLDPAGGNFGMVEWRFGGFSADRSIARRRYAMTARIAVGIDVNSNAVQMVAHFIVVECIMCP